MAHIQIQLQSPKTAFLSVFFLLLGRTYPVCPRLQSPCQVSAYLIKLFGCLQVTNKQSHPSGHVPFGRGSDLTQFIPTKSGSPIIYFILWLNAEFGLLPENSIFVHFPVTPTKGMGQGHTYPQTVPRSIPAPVTNFSPFGPAVWTPIGNKDRYTQTNSHFYILDII